MQSIGTLWYNGAMVKPNKWKAPEWMQPNTRVRVFKGRKHPIGATGTVISVHSTGHGAEAYVRFDAGCFTPSKYASPGFDGCFMVSVLNLQPE